MIYWGSHVQVAMYIVLDNEHGIETKITRIGFSRSTNLYLLTLFQSW
jgi:hypothetical protein